MGFLSRILYPFRSVRREVVTMSNKVVLGGAAAITSQDALKEAGFQLAKVGGKTGRYTVTLQSGSLAARLIGFDVKIIGAADAAFTDGKALNWQSRNDAVKTAGTFDIQGLNPETAADADPQSNLTLLVTVVVGLV